VATVAHKVTPSARSGGITKQVSRTRLALLTERPRGGDGGSGSVPFSAFCCARLRRYTNGRQTRTRPKVSVPSDVLPVLLLAWPELRRPRAVPELSAW
jgi:hypothetical protein